MRIILLFFVLSSSSICIGQENEKVSLMFFVQVLNDNYEEAIFYYQNNWKGHHNNTGQTIGSSSKLPTGTYFYVVNIVGSGYPVRTGYIYLGTN